MPSVGERTSLLGRGDMGGRGYGAQRERRSYVRDIPNKMIVDGVKEQEQDKTVDDYFAIIDKSVKDNVKNAEKVSQDILKILPQLEKATSDSPQEIDEDFSSIAANIIVNFQL